MNCVQEVRPSIGPEQALSLAKKCVARYAKVKYRRLADDFESDILLAMVKRLNAGKPLTEKLLWVIARRQVVSVKRRVYSRKQAPLRGVGADDSLAAQPDRTGPTDSRPEVVDLLSRLEAPDRDVVERHVLGEQSFRKIAEARGETLSTVQRRYRTAIGKLRSLRPAVQSSRLEPGRIGL